MFKRIVVGALLTLALVLGLSPNASAQTITTDNEKWSYATGESEVTGVAQADAMTYLSFRLSAGIKLTSSEKKSSKCKKIKSGTFNKADTSKKYKCYLLYTGVKFVNSGYRGGKLVYFKDVVGSKWSPGPWQKIVKRGSTYYKAGNSSGKGNCGNIVKMTGTQPSLSYQAVILTRTASDIKYQVALAVDLDAIVTAYATATCNTSGASGTASAKGTVKATLTISLMAKTEVEAKAKGKNVKVTVEQVSDFQSKAEIDARLALKAKASAWCKDSTPTPPPPPPPTPAPKVIETETINDVILNNTRTIEVTGTVAPGKTATLFASAKNGGSITANKSQTVSGSFTVKVTYKAPDEVPSSGTDWVEFTLTQNDGQVATASTNKFVIRKLVDDPE